MKKFIAIALLFLTTILWGIAFVVVKDTIKTYGIFSFLMLRFAIGALTLFPFAVRSLDRKAVKVGFCVGFVLFLGFCWQTIGLETTTVSMNGLITSLFLVFAILLNRFLFQVRPNKWVWRVTPVSFVGLWLLNFYGPATEQSIGGNSAAHLGMGEFFTLLCAIAFGLHIVLLDRFGQTINSFSLAFVQLMTVSLFSGCGVMLHESFHWPDREIWFAIIISGVVFSAICYFLQTYSQKFLSATQTAFIMAFEPIFVMFFGYWFHHDELTLLQQVGAIMLISATFIILVLPDQSKNTTP